MWTRQYIVSQPGCGPGEVGYVSRLQMLAGDSPVRITRLLADGRLVGALRQPWVEAPENRDSVSRTPFVFMAYRVIPAAATDTVVPHTVIETIAVVLDGEACRANTTETGETWADEHLLRFGRHTIVASDGRCTFVATNETAEGVESGAKGMVRRIRSARTSRPVTAEDRERLERAVLDAVEKSGRPADAKSDVQRMVKSWRYAKSHELTGRLLCFRHADTGCGSARTECLVRGRTRTTFRI